MGPDGKRFIIAIAGGSGSGKTTFSRRVVAQSRKIGIAGRIFSLDSYYRPLESLSLEQKKAYNFDHPDAIDFDLAVRQLKLLAAGEAVEQPVYDFKTYARTPRTLACAPTPLIVVEGLYALYPQELLGLYHYRIFVATGIATAVLRRLQRDIEERGRDVAGAKRQILTTVLPMYEQYVKPTQRSAHFSIDWDGEEVPEKATEGLVRMVRDFFR
ncbi:MAG: uridine-cytidine kinase [Elusimicrobia bacterium]|nr:uridine-cytidine kinase [Elusimicrobiota bacterium]